VVLADIDDAGGVEVAKRIRAASQHAFFFHADVGQMRQVEALVDTAFQRYGRIDIVHSNAAAAKAAPAAELSEEEWDWTQAVCLKATWMIARAAVPRMLSQGGGVFVITGSVHAIRGYTRHAAYQAAKGGLLALTRSLAADYGPTIRVNIILPGMIETPVWDGVPESERQKLAQRCPLKRNGSPEDIAKVALFLASDMSSYMTGTALVVDGGLTAVIQPLPVQQ
jgi:NAD(P)-dependent dehydrogenase (short-subunit alcohol dehydrogenase family)